MLYSYAQLDAEQLRQIQSLEQEIGKTIVAFKGIDVDITELNTAELERVKQTEDRLGVSLVAVD